MNILLCVTDKGGKVSEPLTESQIKSWRDVLIQMIGPYALIMTKEQIEKFRDRIEEQALRTQTKEKE